MVRHAKAYLAGKKAYLAGQPAETNAVKTRLEWFDGYYDARILDRLGDVFQKHGIVWEEE